MPLIPRGGHEPPPGLAADPHVIVRVGRTSAERRRNLREVEGRAWASTYGVPTPAVLDHDPGGRWLVTERLHPLTSTGESYLQEAFDLAGRISDAPAPDFNAAGSTWRANPLTRPARVIRLRIGGVDPRTFVRCRLAADALPVDGAAHHDFHDSNVLSLAGPDGRHGRVAVIDWEHAGRGSRHGDPLRLVTTMSDEHDVHLGLDLYLARQPRPAWPAVGAMLRWLALRHYADHVIARTPVEPALVSRLFDRWHWAADRAAELGTDA